MMEFMNRLTDKLGWETKVFDEALVAKWKTEALEALGIDISDKMVDWASAFHCWFPLPLCGNHHRVP